MSDAFPKPGDLFEARYRVDSMIGSGGFARVYLARDEELGRQVALKILIPSKDANSAAENYSENLVERFNQEARLVSRLRDNHTITMFDYGRCNDGLLYMVFEFIDGVSLGQLIQSEGALAPIRVSKILRQTLSSLEEAHAFGVLHRDLKPGNIMVFEHVGRVDQAKLLDFGIAKLTSTTQTMKGDLTADGALIGTPRYMSPEQIRGQEMTAQSDIYSLGLVAFEMIVGRKAIESNSSVTIIGAQLAPEPFYVPQRTNIPEGLRAIVNRMLAKDVSVRYQNAREVLETLERWERAPNQNDMMIAVDEDNAATSVLSDISNQWTTPLMPDISDEILPLVEETPDAHSLSREIAASAINHNFAQNRNQATVPQHQSYPPGSLQAPEMASQSSGSLPIAHLPKHQSYPPGTLNPPQHQSYPPGTLNPPQHQSYPPGVLNPPQHPSYPPGPLAPYAGDPSVYVVPAQGPSKTVYVLGAAVVVMLCTIVGFVVFNATRSQEPAQADVVEVIEPEPIGVVEPVKVAPVVKDVRRMTIRSIPAGLRLAVNGRPLGTTPVTIEEGQVTVPMRIRASWKGGSKLVTVKAFESDLLIEPAELAPKEVAEVLAEEGKPKEPEVVAKVPTKTKKKVKARTKKKDNVIASSGEAKKPPKDEEKDTSKKEKGGLSLPGMDDSY